MRTQNELNFFSPWPQSYKDFAGQHRVVRFKGYCVSCGGRVYGHDDGDDDPRGVLGDKADASLVASDFKMEGPDVPCCYHCWNTKLLYDKAVRKSLPHWKSPLFLEFLKET